MKIILSNITYTVHTIILQRRRDDRESLEVYKIVFIANLIEFIEMNNWLPNIAA